MKMESPRPAAKKHSRALRPSQRLQRSATLLWFASTVRVPGADRARCSHHPHNCHRSRRSRFAGGDLQDQPRVETCRRSPGHNGQRPAQFPANSTDRRGCGCPAAASVLRPDAAASARVLRHQAEVEKAEEHAAHARVSVWQEIPGRGMTCHARRLQHKGWARQVLPLRSKRPANRGNDGFNFVFSQLRKNR